MPSGITAVTCAVSVPVVWSTDSTSASTSPGCPVILTLIFVPCLKRSDLSLSIRAIRFRLPTASRTWEPAWVLSPSFNPRSATIPSAAASTRPWPAIRASVLSSFFSICRISSFMDSCLSLDISLWAASPATVPASDTLAFSSFSMD